MTKRPSNVTSNASGTMREAREAQRKLKEIEASLKYSAQVADTIHRLGTWLLGKGRTSEKGGR